ncbi:succinate dehydrogenase assembly factor 3, mitochondrial isoform X2 [Petromyzon marinus]
MPAVRHATRVRCLYRRLLQLHRHLPVEMAELGDRYVKDEFRRNKTAGPRLAEQFLAEWEAYATTLHTQVTQDPGRVIRPGAYLNDEHLSNLREEQVEQLYELMQATTAAPGSQDSRNGAGGSGTPGGSGAAGPAS